MFSNTGAPMISNTNMMKLLDKIMDQDAKAHMVESFKCYKAKAYRASIVMTCLALFDYLRRQTAALAMNDTLGASSVQAELEKYADAEKAFERMLLENLGAKKILDDTKSMVAKNVLELRNHAAHPNNLELTKADASKAFSDTIGHFLSKKVLNHLAPVDRLMERLAEATFFPNVTEKNVRVIVRHELAEIDHQSGYPILISKLAAVLRGNSGPLQTNAVIFVAGLCTLKNPAIRSLIYTNIVARDPYIPSRDSRLMEFVALDPELLSHSQHATRLKLDQLFADICGDTPYTADTGMSDHPLMLYRELIEHMNRTAISSAFPLTIAAVLKRFWFHPDIALGLTNAVLGPTVRMSIYDSFRYIEPEDESRVAWFFLENDELLAKSFHSDDIIDFFRSMSNTNLTGRIGELRRNRFEALPHMKKAAVAGLGDDHEEIKELSLQPPPPARPPFSFRKRPVTASS